MFDVVVGKPIVEPIELGFDGDIIHTDERFLPKILVNLGVFKSNGEVKKNRPDLFVELNKLDFLDIKVGKKHIWIIVGN